MAPRAALYLPLYAVVQFFWQSAEPRAAPPTSPFTALLMDPRQFAAAVLVFSCEAVQNVAAPNILPTNSLISPNAVAEVSIPRFCQKLLALHPATSGPSCA